jgi:hypothetical protein
VIKKKVIKKYTTKNKEMNKMKEWVYKNSKEMNEIKCVINVMKKK